ncbi:stage II sporulation protein D [Desulfosporosinus acidiphilus SJ4]|uniref:Stage II sporulation protein D n=1 Tax=Desulfosporosinus acidiphilus (strain DSM 22704 / JCM 16185 / SJ4) TaxID=646529 RepID=I4DCD2_DESAJ|nr:stage II sporulation protein D [Desulfosporosinus acidiphilus]AFM43456.1 stage II sporulation protein D [Desulfosporosinus acidiphilus SJ4]
MKKELFWLIILSSLLVLIIPWSLDHWQKGKISTKDISIRVLMADGKVSSMPLEGYLVGVVAAEMPAEFELEALKAQAIAARTYAVKQYSKRGSADKGYDVDTTVKTQAWLSNSELRNKWGLLNYFRYRSKLEKAVQETRGLVLVANGDYIDAFYHSSSGRKPTERSEDVWGSPRSYLQNVSSGETNPDRYVETLKFSREDIIKKMGITNLSHPLLSGDFSIVSRTAAGRAKTVKLLGKVYEATQLRGLLGLPSTDIEGVVQGDYLIITAYGKGHAVGMSQWGANDLARQKMNSQEILYHFYPGTKIMQVKIN